MKRKVHTIEEVNSGVPLILSENQASALIELIEEDTRRVSPETDRFLSDIHRMIIGE